MLANDPLGAKRESASSKGFENYQRAFTQIQSDPNAILYVIEDQGEIIGNAQLNYLQYLTYQGGVRAQIEAVRVHHDYRGKGIGKQLFEFLKQQAIDHGCHLIQLTTDNTRPEALAFYEKLGYVNSHNGMKLHLA